MAMDYVEPQRSGDWADARMMGTLYQGRVWQQRCLKS